MGVLGTGGMEEGEEEEGVVLKKEIDSDEEEVCAWNVGGGGWLMIKA